MQILAGEDFLHIYLHEGRMIKIVMFLVTITFNFLPIRDGILRHKFFIFHSIKHKNGKNYSSRHNSPNFNFNSIFCMCKKSFGRICLVYETE